MHLGVVSLLIFLNIVFIAIPSKAQDLNIPGADDAIFQTAVAAWLDDNDIESLPVLSALAKGGNVAARILLSRIEGSDRAPSRFVQGLSRKGRLDLYRSDATASIFRSSWLKFESDGGNPSAIILLAGTNLGNNVQAIEHLIAVGEIEAIDQLIRKVAVDGTNDQRDDLARLLKADDNLMPFLDAFRHMDDGVTTGLAALRYMVGNTQWVDQSITRLNLVTEQASRFVDIGYQAGDQSPGYGVENRYYGAVADWVMNAPAARAVANLCHRYCTEPEIPDCANLALGLVGGYYEIIRFDSPLETIIPQTKFLSSERAVGMTLRKIASFKTEASGEVFSNNEMQMRSSCLADAIIRVRLLGH